MNQEVYLQSMRLGHSAAWDQRWEQATKYYRQALTEVPDDYLALNSLGLALMEQAQFDESLQVYRKAAKRAPEDPAPQENMAKIYEIQGRIEEAVLLSFQAADLYLKARNADRAVQNLVRVSVYRPQNMRAHTQLAVIYERIGRLPSAVKEYLAAASITQHNGDAQTARQMVEYTLKIQPNNQDAISALDRITAGKLLPVFEPGKSGQLNRSAVREAARAREPLRNPIEEATHYALGIIADLVLDPSESNPLFQSIHQSGKATNIRSTPDRTLALSHLLSALEAHSRGRTEQAATEAEKAIASGAIHPGVYFLLGLLSHKIDEQKSLLALTKSANDSKLAMASQLLIAETLEEKKNYTEAVEAYLKAMYEADATSLPIEMSAALRLQYRQITEQIVQMQDTEKMAFVCRSINGQILRRGWKQQVMGIRQLLPPASTEAPPTALVMLMLLPNSSQIVTGLARAQRLVSNNALLPALEELYFDLELAPTEPLLHELIATMMVKRDRIDAAIEKYILVARKYELTGDTNQAVRVLTQAQQLAPTNLTVRNRLIELLFSLERRDDAVRQYMDLAETYYRLADLDKARATYLNVLRLSQKGETNRTWNIEILKRVADIDLQRMDWREGLRIFDQIRGLDPEDMETRSSLVELNYRLGRDAAAISELDSAVTMFDKLNKIPIALRMLSSLIAIRPDNTDLKSRLLAVSRRVKNMSDAISLLDSYADEMIENGNKIGAIVHLETIILLGPPNTMEYRKVLEQLRNG
ncbi:MAG: tetratricopeptide repeat protein [Leptolinea sp.]